MSSQETVLWPKLLLNLSLRVKRLLRQRRTPTPKRMSLGSKMGAATLLGQRVWKYHRGARLFEFLLPVSAKMVRSAFTIIRSMLGLIAILELGQPIEEFDEVLSENGTSCHSLCISIIYVVT